jgi:hypothetical protein
MDARRRTARGRGILGTIAASPARAPAVALAIGCTPRSKHTRKLKTLGLTESLEVGYRLSPRGNAFVHKHG